MKNRTLRAVALAGIIAAAAAQIPAYAAGPSAESIRSSFVATLSQPDTPARAASQSAILDPMIDPSRFARRLLGARLEALPAATQQEIIAGFKPFLTTILSSIFKATATRQFRCSKLASSQASVERLKCDFLPASPVTMVVVRTADRIALEDLSITQTPSQGCHTPPASGCACPTADTCCSTLFLPIHWDTQYTPQLSAFQGGLGAFWTQRMKPAIGNQQRVAELWSTCTAGAQVLGANDTNKAMASTLGF